MVEYWLFMIRWFNWIRIEYQAMKQRFVSHSKSKDISNNKVNGHVLLINGKSFVTYLKNTPELIRCLSDGSNMHR